MIVDWVHLIFAAGEMCDSFLGENKQIESDMWVMTNEPSPVEGTHQTVPVSELV
jgi:hypothetical protein